VLRFSSAPIRHRRAETQADLAVVRSREALVAARVRLVNVVRGMVKAIGGRLPKSTTAAFGGKMAALIPPELKQAMGPLLKSIRALTEQIDRYDGLIEHLGRDRRTDGHAIVLRGLGLRRMTFLRVSRLGMSFVLFFLPAVNGSSGAQ